MASDSIGSLKGFRGILISSILPEFIDQAKFYEILKELLYLSLEKQRLAFVPPNPKLFDIATFTCLSWACPGM